jgi:hypothetical protein
MLPVLDRKLIEGQQMIAVSNEFVGRLRVLGLA